MLPGGIVSELNVKTLGSYSEGLEKSMKSSRAGSQITTVIPALQRLRQKDHKFKAYLGFIDPVSKTRRNKNRIW
jgi:hypothetical protein